MKRCKNCRIPEGALLLNGFFPVGGAQWENHPEVYTVRLDAHGICELCHAYTQNHDRDRIRQELYDFLGTYPADQAVLVALSGGKDSLTALFLAKKVLKLPVRAFTYDNGFIPTKLLERTAEFCEQLDVAYEVVRHELYTAFQKEYQRNEQGQYEAQTGVDFCQICNAQINQVLAEICLREGIQRVIYGNKIYASLEPKVSSIRYFSVGSGTQRLQIAGLHLLYALQTKTQTQELILKELGWEDPKLPGYTSNCLVPGFVAAPRERLLKMASDTGYIEMELRSGAYNAEEVQQLLAEEEKIVDRSAEIQAFFKQGGTQVYGLDVAK